MSAPLLATILYEDSRDGGNEEYPLHQLLLKWAALPDPSGFQFHRFHANPQRGVDKLLKTLKSKAIERMGQRLIALVDEDRIRDKMRVEPSRSLEDVRELLRASSLRPKDTEVFFLTTNMEDLLVDLHHCAGLGADAMPSGKPRPIERDILINKAKRVCLEPQFECLGQRQNDLQRLITLLRESSPPPEAA